MTRGNTDVLEKKRLQTTLPMPETSAAWCRAVSWVFAGDATRAEAATRREFNASPQSIWHNLMLYEEVPDRPPLLLRMLLPNPIRTVGDKARVGATIRCDYSAGQLVKRITAIEPPRMLRFEVIQQRLGIERCVETVGGSYQIRGGANATEVVLTTNYQAYLRPRWMWRRLERLVLSRLHHHILRGLSAAVESPARQAIPARHTVRSPRGGQ